MTNYYQKSMQVTLLVSLYSWDRQKDYDQETKTFINPVNEDVFEVKIKGIEDMTILTHRLGYKVRYKKPTDKNWYTYRAMTKRLFRKEIEDSRNHLEPVFSSVVDLRAIMEERQKLIQEKERKQWELQRQLNDVKYQISEIGEYVEF